MILINYFASYRDRLNLGGEKIPASSALACVEDVRQMLMQRGDIWREVLGAGNLMCAVSPTAHREAETAKAHRG